MYSSRGLLPTEELSVGNETVNTHADVINELNAFFANISENTQQASQGTNVDCEYDPSKLNKYVDSRIPENVHFKTPKMTLLDLINNIKSLDVTKATGLDGSRCNYTVIIKFYLH